jgi:putative restriction endonuclease
MKNREIVTAAFDYISQLALIYGDAVPASELQKGFNFENEVIQLRSSANGIFKPRQMDDVVLSITTTIPKAGGRNIYKDFEGDDGTYHYAFEESSNGEYRNQYLINNYETETPFIYFKAVAPAVYQCIWPCFIEEIDHTKRFIKIIVGEKPSIIGATTPDTLTKPKEIQARYYVRESKTRGHQAEFREEVLKAYSRKCAISGLPEDKLLQAAHIIPDAAYSGSQTVRNGIALNYLHHKAYDSFLLGIDANYTVHISETLKSLDDGPLLEHGILGFDGKTIRLPRDVQSRPDQDLLNRKFEEYLIKHS